MRYEDETVWLTQKTMGALLAVDVRPISEHLGNIFQCGELQKDSVIRKFRITATDGKPYNTQSVLVPRLRLGTPSWRLRRF